jgi:hypothetical protein
MPVLLALAAANDSSLSVIMYDRNSSSLVPVAYTAVTQNACSRARNIRTDEFD